MNSLSLQHSDSKHSRTGKILQLSDCHLLAQRHALLRGCQTYASFKQVCSHIRTHHHDAELILLTGDISQDGSIASYQFVAELLSTLNIPVLALAGNHDDADNMQVAFANSTISLPKETLYNDWQILLLNSCYENQVYGRLDKSELDWLTQALAQHQDKPLLLALHHPPVAINCRWADDIGLKNSAELVTRLTQAKRDAVILFGHIHQVFYHRQDKLAFFGTPSTCRQFATDSDQFKLAFLPPAYRIVELGQNGSHKSFIEFVQ